MTEVDNVFEDELIQAHIDFAKTLPKNATDKHVEAAIEVCAKNIIKRIERAGVKSFVCSKYNRIAFKNETTIRSMAQHELNLLKAHCDNSNLANNLTWSHNSVFYWLGENYLPNLKDQLPLRQGEVVLQDVLDYAGIEYYSIGYGNSRTIAKHHSTKVLAYAATKAGHCAGIIQTPRTTICFVCARLSNYAKGSMSIVDLDTAMTAIRNIQSFTHLNLPKEDEQRLRAQEVVKDL